MDYKKNILPSGVCDYLPEECYNKNQLELSLGNLYKSWGYRCIETPGFEYIDTFTAGVELNKIFKFCDYDGSLLALRADPTLQIARIASDKGVEGVSRYYYILNSYEFWGERASAGRTREFAQAGVELLGSDSVDADAEIVALAVATLKEAGIKDFLIEIGTVGFFKGLTQGLNLSLSQIEEISNYLNQKDTGGLQNKLQQLSITGKKAQDILRAPSMFGGEEVLEEAAQLVSSADGEQAIERLKQLAAKLKAAKIIDNCVFDLGLVPELSYYSGIVIKGMAPALGQPLLSGGRYDKLSRNFGADIPAIGFSAGIKRILTARKNQGILEKLPAIDYAYYVADKEGEALALEEVQNLRAEGKTVARALSKSLDEAKEFCAKNNISKLIIFAGDNKEVIII